MIYKIESLVFHIKAKMTGFLKKMVLGQDFTKNLVQGPDFSKNLVHGPFFLKNPVIFAFI